MFFRGRRLRTSEGMRRMVREHHLRPEDLIMPYFVVETSDPEFFRPISSMPGQSQLSLSLLMSEVKKDIAAGLSACILFGIPAKKDPQGSGAYDDKGIIQEAVCLLKKNFPQLLVITDLCLCEYTSHGHCGVLTDEGAVLNDPTLDLLAKTALAQAKAGADIIAPSDMMDGRVSVLRTALDTAGYTNTPLMSYAVKYASAFYGPFREAAESTPACGDRKAYQMDPSNSREAIREAQADINEGADMLIIKPAGPYLDIIHQVSKRFFLPIVAYQVSGEYALIKAAGQNGWIDEDRVIVESLIGIKRAGADMIISYFTSDLLRRRIIS